MAGIEYTGGVWLRQTNKDCTTYDGDYLILLVKLCVLLGVIHYRNPENNLNSSRFDSLEVELFRERKFPIKTTQIALFNAKISLECKIFRYLFLESC